MNEAIFSGKADIYAKYRPGYPQALFDHLYTNICFSAASTIADIGAGTGIFSKPLAERNSAVVCIEPNQDMLMQAQHTSPLFQIAHSSRHQQKIPAWVMLLLTLLRWLRRFTGFNASDFRRSAKESFAVGEKLS